MKTLAAVLESLTSPLALCELDVPKLNCGQVLVKVYYSGLCHSQLNEIKGRKGPDPFLPHTLGHEGSGIVVEVGEGVTKVRPDDRVVISWIKGGGLDVPSTQYLYKGRRVNSGAVSTFLNFAVISENRLIPIPAEMPLREAALLGCALPTGAGVVRNEMGLEAGRSLAIFGAGGLGLCALLAARAQGAHPLIAVDVHEAKLQKALQMGATHAINAKDEDAVAAIRTATGGQGVDFAMECAGRREPMEAAFSSIKRGGLCVLAGNLPKGERISIDPFDLIAGKKIRGTWGGASDIDRDVAFYVECFLRGELPLGQLVTHEVPLQEINTLVEELEMGRVGRGLVVF